MDVYRIASGADLENFVGGGKSKKILFALVIILYREGEGGGASQYSKHFIGVSLVGHDNVSFQWSWSGPPVSPSGSSN